MREGPIKELSFGPNVYKTTPLESLHKSLDARMVPFAGFLMPLQYETGIICEHNHTRNHASLFDISHMGQIRLLGDGASEALETLVPGDITSLSIGSMRYTMLTNDKGNILDDIMVTRQQEGLSVVVNASCIETDLAHLKSCIGSKVEIDLISDRGLIALQGPDAAAKLGMLAYKVIDMPFMSAQEVNIQGIQTIVSRCGYTGEDGFEISAPTETIDALTRKLLEIDQIRLAGIGARDTLRLEAGLCLYGQDIDTTTTPIEAGLHWTIGKRRREKGGFPGANVIQHQLTAGISRKLVGIRPHGRVPARAGAQIKSQDGIRIGIITSGSFGPTVGGPVAMGYVITSHANIGMSVSLDIRGKSAPAIITKLPFIQHRYFKHSTSVTGDK